ncbi:unnamed protein product [Meganyctiphanes norvegica]|uniref:Exo-alpha-sialidase n=1 Tax=Meganyctiphanes norvegica TaxID=48144 RepID=A0AAV2PQK4_MEGNR
MAGLRLDLRGCTINQERNAPDICTTAPSVPYANQGMAGRHIALDSIEDVFYFCESLINKQWSRCYSSGDSGTTWKGLPVFLSNVLGYWTTSNQIFASNQDQSSFFYTNDTGLTWTSTSHSAYATASSSSGWEGAQSLDYSAPLSGVTKGDWTADHMGVSRGGNLYVTWDACCSHTF